MIGDRAIISVCMFAITGGIFVYAYHQPVLPKYCSVLLRDDYREYVSEIIIEGHTDTNGSYIYNLELSQQRTFSVAKYCLTESNGIISSGHGSVETRGDQVQASGRRDDR